MKKYLKNSLVALLLIIGMLTGCAVPVTDVDVTHTSDVQLEEYVEEVAAGVEEDGEYSSKEEVAEYHEKGYGVRAWGMANVEIMKNTIEKGVDGMTVNFPDKLTEYLKNK